MAGGVDVLVGEAADTVVDGVVSVRVHERLGCPTTFAVGFDFEMVDDDIPALEDPNFDPETRLTVRVNGAAGPVDLVHGPIIGQYARIESGGGGSWLEVRGADVSIEMDREFKSRVWASSSDSTAVMAILGEHQLVPDAEDTSSVHTELRHELVQRDSDLRFVQRMARRNGKIFWVTSEGPVHTGHFKAPPTTGPSALELDVGADGNITFFELTWDSERPTSTTSGQLDSGTLGPIDGSLAQSGLPLLGMSGLGQAAPSTRSVHVSAPSDDAADLLGRSEGTLTEAGWWIKANTVTTYQALDDVVRAHTLVQVNGVGTRHSGTWLVSGVLHEIDGSGHTMTLELIRNAWEV